MMRRIINRLFPKTAPVEPLMYRVHLFHELIDMAGKEAFAGKRILEIGPKDGLDSLRLVELGPSELCMVELPEKKTNLLPSGLIKSTACTISFLKISSIFPKINF